MAHTIDGSGNYNTFWDVHAASDGKISHYGIKTRFSIPDKQKLIDGLIKLVNDRANESIKASGVQALIVISRDAGQAPNWQGVDGIFVDDVLAEICALLIEVKEQEVIDTVLNHLCEQFSDMINTSGWCSSGRLRVIQVYMFLKDYLNGIYLPKV